MLIWIAENLSDANSIKLFKLFLSCLDCYFDISEVKIDIHLDIKETGFDFSKNSGTFYYKMKSLIALYVSDFINNIGCGSF